MKQLSLFDREERSAIIEFDGGTCRMFADYKSSLAYQFRGPIPYLLDLIENKEPLIHLCGENPNLCLVRSFSSWEPDIVKDLAWASRQDACRVLKKSQYTSTRILIFADGQPAEIWHRHYR